MRIYFQIIIINITIKTKTKSTIIIEIKNKKLTKVVIIVEDYKFNYRHRNYKNRLYRKVVHPVKLIKLKLNQTLIRFKGTNKYQKQIKQINIISCSSNQ